MNWIAWTPPTAIFFIAIGGLLVVMTLWEVRRPTRRRRGFLPLATTRGDRLFIGLLSAAFLHLLWLGAVGHGILWASGLAVVWAGLVLRWG